MLAMALNLVEHPIIRERLTRIRSIGTGTADFRAALHDVARLLCFEVTRDFQTRERPVVTPLCGTTGHELVSPVVLCPILRAGLGLLPGFTEILTEASVATIGLCRDEQTHLASCYHLRVPAGLDGAEVIVLDPMLATGGSAGDAIDALKEAGATRIRLACLIAAPEGVAALQKRHPEVAVYAAALDECLDHRAYIVPGLGDAGDRYFGT